ncbi:TRAP transporter small permease [Paramicrobacterium chengjingii]|uniref:TRAP transporter small permease n=1 Tax=Paramicrobacterium chengjingii TaxID=2769067 RepID=UPI00141F321A|nr:TRAP transporter small permease [Microbacterium chengjingii]
MSRREMSMSGDPAESTPLRIFRTGANRVSSASGFLSAVAIVLMTLGIALDVLLRTVSGHGIPGVIEAADPLLVCVAFFALSATEMKGEHISLALVTDRLGARIRYALITFGTFLCIVFTCLLAYAGLHEALESLSSHEVRAGVVRIPMWPARVAVVLGSLALLVQFIVTCIDAARSARAGTEVGVWKERDADNQHTSVAP